MQRKDLRKGMRTLQEGFVPKIVTLKRNFAPLEGVKLQKEVPLQEKITPLVEVGLQKKSHSERDGCSAERGNHAERGPSTRKDHSRGRGQLQKKSHPAEAGS